MHPLLISIIGFVAGAVLVALFALTGRESSELDAYRRGYETAVREQRERHEARARKAAQTRRAKA